MHQSEALTQFTFIFTDSLSERSVVFIDSEEAAFLSGVLLPANC